ncbi:hypothetical protein [Ilumatobacter nonamiensis]|uniref:hypothetical protein n=1 Tax=Ilumatobacter nonamiensis TaxID=467093 RepID=UPI00034B3533|nr:hypothetical protein [Ilumatobacter nonamiensis]
MAASKKKPSSTVWYDGDTPFEDLEPSKQVAHEIVDFHRDLAPSVDRIMTADLTETQRHHAIGLFQTALGAEDDPHRDPRVAIAAASD